MHYILSVKRNNKLKWLYYICDMNKDQILQNHYSVYIFILDLIRFVLQQVQIKHDSCKIGAKYWMTYKKLCKSS